MDRTSFLSSVCFIKIKSNSFFLKQQQKTSFNLKGKESSLWPHNRKQTMSYIHTRILVSSSHLPTKAPWDVPLLLRQGGCADGSPSLPTHGPLRTYTTLSRSRWSRHSAIKDSAPKRPRPTHTGANPSAGREEPELSSGALHPRLWSSAGRDAVRPSSSSQLLPDRGAGWAKSQFTKTFREHEIRLPSQISIHLHFSVFFCRQMLFL